MLRLLGNLTLALAALAMLGGLILLSQASPQDGLARRDAWKAECEMARSRAHAQMDAWLQSQRTNGPRSLPPAPGPTCLNPPEAAWNQVLLTVALGTMAQALVLALLGLLARGQAAALELAERTERHRHWMADKLARLERALEKPPG